MLPDGKVMHEATLGNGLKILFIDQSKPVVGGRWHVQLLIRIPIEVKEEYFQHFPDPNNAYAEFVSAFGTTISFETERVRNFIDEKDVQPILQQLKDEFLRSNTVYVSKADFAKKTVLRRFQEWEEQQRIRKAYDALRESSDRDE